MAMLFSLTKLATHNTLPFCVQVVDPESGTLVRTKPRVERTRSLVTGGAGFVGSHLCDYLVQRGDHVRPASLLSRIEFLNCCRLLSVRPSARPQCVVDRLRCLSQVICLDNFFTGTRENVAHLLEKPNFELIRHDVVNPILLEVDEIYHLACPASPVHYKYVSTWPAVLISTTLHGA